MPETPSGAVAVNQPRVAEPDSPLRQAKQKFRQDILTRLGEDWIKLLDGIGLLEQLNAVADFDKLCTIFNRLASIERTKFRSGRRPMWRRVSVAGVPPAGAGPYGFALGEKQGLDAEAVEVEIKRRLEQRYHRFISQAVNNMEFGRGKPTSGYPGLLHVSAGIVGVGSCSVFYYNDAEQKRIRIVGIGHHLDGKTYRLDYAIKELGGCGRILRVS